MVTDPELRITGFAYLSIGWLDRRTNAKTNPTLEHDAPILDYTVSGRLASVTDTNGNRTDYEYDAFNRLAKTVFPSGGGFEQRGYGAGGRLTSLTTRAGVAINFAYDALDRLSATTVPGGDTVARSYDIAGRLTHIANDWGAIDYAYDAAGRVTAVTFDAGGDGLDTRTVSYTYDGNGNRLTMTWPDGYAARYEYDALDRLVHIYGRPSGGAENALVRYEWDRLSRRTAVIRFGGAGARTDYAYEIDDDLATLTHGFAGETLNYAYT